MQLPDLAEVRRTLHNVRRLRQRLRGEPDVEALVAEGLELGNDVYLAPWVLIDHMAACLISIGDSARLAPRVQVLAHDASTRLGLGYTRLAPVRIGCRVFVGADTLVLPGVTIGDDSIIGAGSLVSSDIPPGSLAVGRPAKVVGTTQDFFDRWSQRVEEGAKFEVVAGTMAGSRALIQRQVERFGEAYIR